MEWSGVSLLMADHTFSSRHCLAEEGFFLEPLLGWFRLDSVPFLTNVEPFGSVFLALELLEFSNWALGPTYAQIQVPWPFIPTIAPRDPFFLLHGGKGGSQCDSCPLSPLFITLECEASFELSKPRPWRFGTRGTLSLKSYRSTFLVLNNAIWIQWFESFVGIWAGFVSPITLRLLFWISWEIVPTRLGLLYKASRESFFLIFADSWVLEKSQVLHFYKPSQWPW